jgi:hypothetical protein
MVFNATFNNTWVICNFNWGREQEYPEKTINLLQVTGDCMVVGFTTTCTMSITTKVVSLYPVHGEVYSIQHYVIEFVSDLQQVDCFLRVLQFPPPIKIAYNSNIVEDNFIGSRKSCYNIKNLNILWEKYMLF